METFSFHYFFKIARFIDALCMCICVWYMFTIMCVIYVYDVYDTAYDICVYDTCVSYACLYVEQNTGQNRVL
jgi:hypothetical protein